MRKQIHFEVPQELYEEFHRLLPERGEKRTFFVRMMELAVEKGKDWSFVERVVEEVTERYG